MTRRLFIFVSIFIPLYLLYLKTMPPTVFWQDSGIFLAGFKHFGIVYPPGFPLYMFLGVLWVKILSFVPDFLLPLNFAQKVHTFSGLWGAGAAGLVGLSVYEIIHKIDGKAIWGTNKRGGASAGLRPELRPRVDPERPMWPSSWSSKATSIMTAVISGLTAGLSYSLWAQSINAEIYSLAGFFAALLFFLATKIVKAYRRPPFEKNDFISQQKKYRKYLILLALIWGLSFAIHPLTITFLPPLFWLFLNLRLFPFFKAKISPSQNYRPLLPAKVWLLALAIFLFSAFTPYLYLPIRSASNPAVMWSRIDSPQAFIDHVSGKSYRTAEGAIKPPEPEKLKSYPILFFQEFFVLGIVLGILGLLSLFKNPNPAFGSFALFGIGQAAILYLLISFYERGTEYNFWLIPFYLFWSILIGIGILWLVKKITVVARSPFGGHGDLDKIASPRYFGGARHENLNEFPRWSFCVKFFLIFFLALGILGPPIGVNWPILNRADYTLAEEFGKNLIGKLPQNSIFFTLGDQESSIPMYLQLVLGYRQDVVVIADSDLVYGWKRERLTRFHPDLWVPTQKTGDLTPEESGEVINKFVAANLPQRPIFVITKNYLPFSPEFRLIPSGTVWKITTEENPEIDLAFWQYSFSDPGRYERPERKELSRKKRRFEGDKEIVTYERAPYFAEAQVFELQGKKNLGDLCFGDFRGGKTLKVKTVEGQHKTWQGEKLLECAQKSYEAMFEIDPQFYHREVFLNLAEIYKKVGKAIEAERLIKETEEKR